jgi:serine/threonine protein kinase
MVGVPPQSSVERKRDDRMGGFLNDLQSLYSTELIDLVRWSLQLDPLQRPQSVYALQKLMRPLPGSPTMDSSDAASSGNPQSLLSRLFKAMH